MPDQRGVGPLAPPPGQAGQLPISPRAPDIQSGTAAQVGGPSSGPLPQAAQMQLPPPPEAKQSIWSKLLPYLPTLAGGAMGIIGGPDSAIGNFGAGGAKAGSQMLIQDALQKHQEEAEADANRMKNVSARLDKARRLAATDPRYNAVIQAHDQALADSKYTAKEAANISQMLDALPDPEIGLKNLEFSQAAQQHEALGRIDSKLKDEDLRRTGIPMDIGGHQTYLSPEHYLSAQQHADAAKWQQTQHEDLEKNRVILEKNRQRDDQRADEQLGWERADRREADSSDTLDVVARAVLAGTPLAQAQGMAGSAKNRGALGARALERAAQLADENTPLVTDPKAKAELKDWAKTQQVLNSVESELNRIHTLPPTEKASAIIQFNDMLKAYAPYIAKATGAAPVSDFDAARALGLLPGALTGAALPEYAKQKIAMARRMTLGGKKAIIEQYAYKPAGGGLAPPPGGATPTTLKTKSGVSYTVEP